MQLVGPGRLGSGPGHRLAGLRPRRIRRPRPHGPCPGVPSPCRRSTRHDLPRDPRRDEPPYKLNVGDEIRVESFTDAAITRDLIIQPDGTITLRLLGQVHATGKTVPQLRDELEKQYLTYYKVPAITVTPLRVNTKLEDLRATIDRRAGVGGQSQSVRVTPRELSHFRRSARSRPKGSRFPSCRRN